MQDKIERQDSSEGVNNPEIQAFTESVLPSAQLPANPKVTIFIDGLALLWLNRAAGCAEAGFVKLADQDQRHRISLSIYDNECKLLMETPWTVTQGDVFTIMGSQRGYGRVFQPDNNPEPANVNDYRWIINLDRIHSPRFPLKVNPPFLARVRIHNAIFFTPDWALSSDPGNLSNGVNPISRRVGKVIGAAIDDDVVILDKNNVKVFDTAGLAGPFQIILTYKCLAGETPTHTSDFIRIYDVFETGTSAKYNLIYGSAEGGWESDCEIRRFQVAAKRIYDFILENPERESFQKNLSEIRAEIEFLHLKTSCEVACQAVAALGEIR